MEFSIERSAIFEALNLVSTVIDRKSTISVLANVHIKANEDNSIELQGANMLNHIKATVTGSVAEAGVMTVSAHKFLSMVKEANDVIRLRYSGGGIAYMSFGQVDTELAVESPESFPIMNETSGEEILVDAGLLSSKIGRAIAFVSNDETRKMLTGVSFRTEEGNLKIASTNSHQLYRSVLSCECNDGIDIILPDKTAKLVQSMSASVKEPVVSLITDGRSVKVVCGNYKIFSKLIDAKYPQYEAVIPDYDACAIIDRDVLKKNIRLASIIMDDYDKTLSLDFNNSSLEVHSKNSNSEKVKNKMEVDYSGNPYGTSVNSDYMSNIINTLSADEVNVYFDPSDTGANPLLVKASGEDNEGDLCVVMPVRF